MNYVLSKDAHKPTRTSLIDSNDNDHTDDNDVDADDGDDDDDDIRFC